MKWLIALKDYPYAGIQRRKGDRFQAPDGDAQKLLDAKYARVDFEKSKPVYNTRQLEDDDSSPETSDSPRRTYKRRDLKAEK